VIETKTVPSEKAWFMLEKFCQMYSNKSEVNEVVKQIQFVGKTCSPASMVMALFIYLQASAEAVEEILNDLPNGGI
jgi:hypothetical protein